jgi:hypothetical protein
MNTSNKSQTLQHDRNGPNQAGIITKELWGGTSLVVISSND